jgi:streptogramin lyase
MRRAQLKIFLAAMSGVAIAPVAWPAESIAYAVTGGVLRLPGRVISVAAPKSSAGHGKAVLDVTLRSIGRHAVAVARSDFTLSARGDMFGVQGWSARRSRVTIAPGHGRVLRLTFAAPSTVVAKATLSYRPAPGGASAVVPLRISPARRDPVASASTTESPTVQTFWATDGVGDPWGTAIDGSGKIWFAEPGCDLAPTCAANAPPGQIGAFDPGSGRFTFYTLPSIPGNQPIFVAFDSAGNLWFTTPGNDMIGELSPSTRTFVGQWPVTAGSGPWDLTFANGQIWYTEHLASAVGRFDPSTHAHQDFPTPSVESNPYGITADGDRIWFTENNSSVDRVAVLDTSIGNAISEYPIVRPLSGTPHLVVMGANHQPWWTEGWSDTIATLLPPAATPGICGTTSGTCNGVQRFHVPPSDSCGGSSHTSGIAFESSADRVWLDNSETDQVGSFTPSTGAFAMSTLSSCSAHPHDGLNLDPAGDVWFDEQFTNAIGELIPPSASVPQPGIQGEVTETIAVVPPPPTNASLPTIAGRALVGRTLTVTKGIWANDPGRFVYQWQRCRPGCTNIARATGDYYTLSARDVGAKARAIVTASNAGGSAQATSSELGPVGPSVKGVTAALSTLLAASVGDRRITRLLKSGRCAIAFRAPSAGSLALSWTAIARHARRVGGGRLKKARPVRVAAARVRISEARVARVTLRLTSVGRRLVRHATRLTLVARATFVPVGGAAVTRLEGFTLRSVSR